MGSARPPDAPSPDRAAPTKPTAAPRRRRWRRWAAGLLLLAALALAAVWSVTVLTTAPPRVGLAVQTLTEAAGSPAPAPGAAPRLRVLTQNLAHGRGTGLHQALQSGEAARATLDRLAAILARREPHLLAVQEADGPSWWSGSFDHVAHLARRGGWPYRARSAHVDGLGLAYGTALLATVPLTEAEALTFEPSPPTFAKGCTLATFAWPGRTDRRGTVASVHLDFSRAAVRRRQVARLIAALAERPRPLLVLGDFNSGWQDRGVLRRLCAELDLRPWRPTEATPTFPTLERRLDWILISPDLRFHRRALVRHELSDHLGVLAELELVAPSPRPEPDRPAGALAPGAPAR
jgi:endonuclease/exonuclease/phosphatase family metal-dependent hydrolase